VERLAAFQALPSWQKQKAAIERGEIATDVLTAIANDEGDTYSDAVRKSASKILGL
jgi:hypothetical protein